MKKINNLFPSSAFLPILIIVLIFCVGYSKPRDPTRPPDSILSSIKINDALPTQSLTLVAIFSYPDARVAIINEKAVKTGDQLGEYVVTTIAKDTVELTDAANNRLVLHLSPTVKMEKHP